MPYTLKTQQISVKDPDSGEYIGVDVLAEQNKESLIAEIQSEGDLQVERVDQKAAEILAAGDAQVTRIDQTGTNVKTLVNQEEARAQQIVTDAQTSLNTLETQKNTIAETVASMAELGTDTTLTTPGMAADAKAVGDVKGEVDNLGDFVYDQDSGLSTKAPAITDSASSGDIVTFESDVEGGLVSKLKGTIEPIQDFHGYDYPWPGGGGKNLFENTATSLTDNGVTFTVNSDGTVSCSGTATGTAVMNMVDANGINQLTDSLILSGCPAGGSADTTYGLVATTSGGVRIVADNGSGVTMESYATFSKLQIIIRSGVNANNLVFKPMIRRASVSDGAYAPYTNICPITGYTDLTVKRTSKNLINDTIWAFSGISRMTFGTGLPDLKDFLNSLPDGTYTVSAEMKVDVVADATKQWSFGFWGQGAPINSYIYATNPPIGSVYRPSFTITKTASTVITSVYVYASSNQENDRATISHWQVEQSSSVTDYKASNLVAIPITFPTEAGTVYSGTIDPISGKMVVDVEQDVFTGISSENWAVEVTPNAGTNFYIYLPYSKKQQYSTNSKFISNQALSSPNNFSQQGYITISNGKYLNVALGDILGIQTVADWRTYLSNNPFQVVYELATPIEYQCTPAEVKTLLGTNNIWLDTGTITECIYPKDTKKYIDNKSVIKAPVIINHAEGEIASFTDGADSMPVKSLVASIEPVQDLHGYDNPWPAGGGKNLLSSENISRFNATSYGVTYTVQEDGSIKATGTVTTQTWNFADFYTPISTYGLSVGDTISLTCFGDDVNFAVHFYDESTQLGAIDAKTSSVPTATIPSGTTRFRMLVYCKASSGPAVGETFNKTFYPQLEKASTPSSIWYPYANLCPISGHTGMTVTRTGKNLFDSDILLTANGWTVSDGVYSGQNYELDRVFSFYKRGIPGIKFKENTRYTFAANFRGENAVLTVAGFAYTDGTRSEGYWSDTTETRKTVTSQANKTVEFMYLSYGSRNVIYLSDCQLEESSTESTYESYTGATVPITWETEAGTMYGGMLDTVSGKLVSTMGLLDLGSIDWRYESGLKRFLPTNDVQIAKKVRTDTVTAYAFCSSYKVDAVYRTATDGFDNIIGITDGGKVRIKNTAYTDPVALKAALSGVQFVYELIEPIEYTLSTNELTTLLGTNNIWTDAGSVSVDYSADTKLFIQNAIAEALSSSSNP